MGFGCGTFVMVDVSVLPVGRYAFFGSVVLMVVGPKHIGFIYILLLDSVVSCFGV